MGQNKRMIILMTLTAIVTALITALLCAFLFSSEEEEIIMHKITFEDGFGVVLEKQEVEDGEKVEKPTNPEKEGYVFGYWKYEGEEFDFSTIVTKDMTITADWLADTSSEESVVVEFDSNGGSSVESQTLNANETATKPNNPTRDGYTFKGWYLDDKEYDFSTSVTENITLEAKWEKKTSNTSSKPSSNSKPSSSQTSTTQYTVTFNSNGGTAVQSQTVKGNSTATKPANPTKEGYNFKEWQLNNTTYNFSTRVNKNITLTAAWTQKNYQISASAPDQYSPDRVLSVYEDGNKINVSSIKYSDGSYLCSGSNTTVSSVDIAGETKFIVVLSGGTQVTATLR